MRHTKWTTRTRTKFFKVLAETGIVTDACDAVHASRARAYELKREDPEFRAAWEQAEELSADILEREARRRAVTGCQKYVVAQGRVIEDPRDPGQPLTVQEYSDVLLALLLKARRPAAFGDKSKIEVETTTNVAAEAREIAATMSLAQSTELYRERLGHGKL